jgi:class 3 adenylate cyclase/DNA-binding MarR family transcriptional regulator
MDPAKPARKVQRRLAAIFCADVAGYTRLMNADEGGTLRLLAAHRDITDRQIGQNGGRIANTAGDSILAEFPSAVDALQCALGIQERIAAVNDDLAEDRRVSFRIGLHVGEAMVRDGDLFGDGVNVAARMQSLAEPGSVCLSAAAHEYVHRVLPLRFEDLGLQRVKNFDTPIRAYLVRPSGRPLSRSLPPAHRHLETYLSRRFHDLCLRALAEVTNPEGLTPLEPPVLASINDAPGLDERQLAERLGLERAAVRRTVRRLEQRGLVRRAAGADGRPSRALHSTATGVETHQSLRSAIVAALDRVMAPLSDRERQTLQELLARVIKANETRGLRG